MGQFRGGKSRNFMDKCCIINNVDGDFGAHRTLMIKSDDNITIHHCLDCSAPLFCWPARPVTGIALPGWLHFDCRVVLLQVSADNGVTSRPVYSWR
jgi:hypothetical protein